MRRRCRTCCRTLAQAHRSSLLLACLLAYRLGDVLLYMMGGPHMESYRSPPRSPRFHAVLIPPRPCSRRLGRPGFTQCRPLHPLPPHYTPSRPSRAWLAARPHPSAPLGRKQPAPLGRLAWALWGSLMGSLHEDSAEYVPTDCAKVLCNRLHAAAPLMSAEISPLHVLCDLVHLGSLLTSAAPSPLQVLCDLVSVGSFIRTASYHPSRCSAISCTVSSAPLIVCVVASPIPSCPPHYHLSRHCQGLRRLAHSLVSAALSPSRQPL